jgi:hypothetical protein
MFTERVARSAERRSLVAVFALLAWAAFVYGSYLAGYFG